MDAMDQVEPIQSDMTEMLPLEQQLKSMSRKELIQYADDIQGLRIDKRVKDEAIREQILKIDAARKIEAAKVNEESLKMTVDKSDPKVKVRFFNLESPGADLEFAYSEPRGLYGKEYTKNGIKYGNPKGHKKCPKYHLFPGAVVEIAHSVYEHLSSKTFVTHKTLWDPVTGMIKGNIPIIKPRFILQPIFTKEDLLNINKNK